ncbi:hypothetical protein LX36DRAFT_284163 [Colletotrichum falcatum]|nr:hypothetical protein LX36DRAFT_284163 [Colletotrichum falcatum]
MATAGVSYPSAGRDDAQQNESTRPRDGSPRPGPPDDEESATAVEPATPKQQSTSSNGYTYGTAVEPPAAAAAPKPTDDAPRPPATRALAPDLLRGLLAALMAMDHTVIILNAWPHSTAADGPESDASPVGRWTRPVGYAVRALSHLCAPGFAFLLGAGVVYFCRSRARLGWTPARLAAHFAARAAVLTAVSCVLGLALTAGRVWFLNMVLVALAVDYLLAGLLWLALAETEPALASALDRFVIGGGGRERTPLLVHNTGHGGKASARAQSVSWHAHNALLLALASVTIWWNVWLSPTHGTCTASSSSSSSSAADDFWRFWFYEVDSPRVKSGFPPLAWLSFAVLGLLYGRVVLARPDLRPAALSAGPAAAGLLFACLFVLTRVLRVGNLSEGCLRTPDQAALPPGANPYLASAASFFYVVKYPPDVAFFAYAAAATLLLLAALGAVPPRFATRRLGALLLALGSSALFFYATHLAVLSALAALVVLPLFGREDGRPPPAEGRPAVGVDSVPVYWATWAAAMAVMYPLCRRYSAFKQTRSADSVWRFF